MARPGYEPKGRTFESCRAYQANNAFIGIIRCLFLFYFDSRSTSSLDETWSVRVHTPMPRIATTLLARPLVTLSLALLGSGAWALWSTLQFSGDKRALSYLYYVPRYLSGMTR